MTDFESGAVLSQDLRHRYLLRRSIEPNSSLFGSSLCEAALRAEKVLFVMLNPSTADAFEDDMTIRKCRTFAAMWGASWLTVVNVFSFRATNPDALCRVSDPWNQTGDQYVQAEIAGHKNGIIVAAWGRHAMVKDRKWIPAAIGQHGGWCLGVNQDGSPKHPLYVPYAQPLVPYARL